MKPMSGMRLLLLITVSFLNFSSRANEYCLNTPFQNIIVVNIDTKGQASIGKDTFDMEGLSRELHQRFWKSYLGTGKMQDALQVNYTGNVPAEIKKEVTDAIKKAQQNALIDLCLQLHKKKYEDLSLKQQKKIKTKYLILFQQKF